MYTPSIASNMRSFAERGGAEGADMCDANSCVRAARAGLRLHALQPNQCSINGAAWVAYSVRTGCAVPKGQPVGISYAPSASPVNECTTPTIGFPQRVACADRPAAKSAVDALR